MPTVLTLQARFLSILRPFRLLNDYRCVSGLHCGRFCFLPQTNINFSERFCKYFQTPLFAAFPYWHQISIGYTIDSFCLITTTAAPCTGMRKQMAPCFVGLGLTGRGKRLQALLPRFAVPWATYCLATG
jgi:hypothetical protein